MCMLCLDTSLKAIHNDILGPAAYLINVYAMLRYKFESNSQLVVTFVLIKDNVYAMLRYKFESNSQLAAVAVVCLGNVYAMLRYKFESNSQQQQHEAGGASKCVCYA